MSISDVPSGSDPYLIEFNASVDSGIPTEFRWAFGDGFFANGSGPGYAQPSHRYPGPGAYNVSVRVFEGTLNASQFLPLTLPRAPLRVGVVVHGVGSAGGRTVAFNASIFGGSGNYPSVLWSFGDGGTGSGVRIQYTYQAAGHYTARVTVTDSAGIGANATIAVAVGGGSTDSADSGALAWSTLGIVAAIVGGTLGVAVLGTRWFDRRALRRQSIEIAPVLAPTPPGPPAEPRPEIPPAPGLAVPEALPEAAPAAPSPPEAPPRRPVRAESLRVSERIVLRIASLGTLAPDEVAPVGFTQKGLASSLSVSQNALTNVVRRLLAAGILSEDVRHVRGESRRLKVYRLTPRGEALARELRVARAGVTDPGDPREDPPE